ncbi:MAG: SLBB domain-containing protein, partial [Nitrospinae bacterium]|nr:SLBB domain-containing protein [Nitrospinota bacterium]
LESIEGRRGNPKLKPPFPAIKGVYEKPTVINNVETICAVPYIMINGADAYKKYGTEKSVGTKIFCISGHVNKPGNYELPLGFPLKELIYDIAGGIKEGRKLKAVIPGGSSTPMLPEDKIDINLDYESIAEAGSMLGSGAVIVIDDRTCIVKTVKRLIKFYQHESCGKCTPCREGTAWMKSIYERLESGEGKEGDIETLEDICDNISFKSFCPLGDAAIGPVLSSIKHFRNEYEEHIQGNCCEEVRSEP